MSDNEKGSLGRLGLGHDFVGARYQQLGYERIVPHRFAINPSLTVRTRHTRARQLQLARYYRLGKITFADEIRDDEYLANPLWEKKTRIAQARFLFPKSALDIGKNFSALNFACVSPSGCARVRVHRQPFAHYEEG